MAGLVNIGTKIFAQWNANFDIIYPTILADDSPNEDSSCLVVANMPFKVIEGHRFWYKSKAHIRLSISD